MKCLISIRHFFYVFGNVLSKTDALTNTTSYEYNLAGNLVKIIDANGAVTEYTYNTNGKLSAEKDPEGLLTKYGYYSFGRLESVTDRNGVIQTFTYDRSGNTASVVYTANWMTKVVRLAYYYTNLGKTYQIKRQSVVLKTWTTDCLLCYYLI